MGDESATDETSDDWRAANRANWDERVAIHLASAPYDLTPLREGRALLNPIEEAELGPVAGLAVLHLQCHFGRDTLALAQRGAVVVGLDFSQPAIETARTLAREVGLADRARFIQSDLYDAPVAIGAPAAFDLVYVTWGAINWLPDVRRWAEIVAHFLKPGGRLYLVEGHPAAAVFDDETASGDGFPGWFVPYFHDRPLVLDTPYDYADTEARIANSRTYEWIHPVGEVVTALIDAGLALDWLHDHDAVGWRMFRPLAEGADGMFRWPDKRWLPLAYSLSARRPAV